MRYLIAHVLTGTVADFHKTLTREIANKFGVQDLAERIHPHLTLKAPFETSEIQIKELQETMKNFASHHDRVPLRLNEFEHFGNNVVYLNAETTTSGRQLLKSLSERIAKIEWLKMDSHDNEVVLHATLARPENHVEFQSVMNFLYNNYDPHFSTELDTIDLLKLDESQWYTHFSQSL